MTVVAGQRATAERGDSRMVVGEWPRVPLAEVCYIDAPIVDPRHPDHRDLPHVSGESIESGTGRLRPLRTAKGDGMMSGKYLFDPNVVLYSKLRPYLRKVAVAAFRGLCSADMYPLVFDRTRVSLEFAKFVLLTNEFTDFVVEASARARMPKVNREQLLVYAFPLPPLAEQERIAGRLTGQFVVAERVRAAAESRLAAAEALPTAILREVFEGSAASGWETVDHACLSIDYGHTASAKATASGPRFLRITDIQASRVNWATVPGCEIDAADEATLGLADGDIVFARTGATTGKSFLLRSPPRAVFASYLIRLRVDPAVARPDFLYLFFQSDAYWEQLRSFARGAAQPNVNATLLGQIELPLPPLLEQRRIAESLSQRLTAAQSVITRCRDELAAIESLPAALLRQAFDHEST